MGRRSSVKMRLVLCHLQLLVLLQLFAPMLVGWFTQGARIIWCAVLQVCRREVRCGVGERASRNVVLMVAKSATMSANATMILVLVVQMVTLVRVALALVLTLKPFVESHLVLVSVPSAAIQQAVILPVAAVIVHAAIGIMRR